MHTLNSIWWKLQEHFMMFNKTLDRIKALAFYKRSIFLINPKFQLKFSAIVCSIMLVATLIYPLIIFDFFNEVVSKNPDFSADIQSAKTSLIIYLIGIQIFFTFLVFILFIFFTHKIAGPMFKLKNHLARIREGEAITPLTFRDGDHFHDVAEEVTLFLETLVMNQENDFQYLDEVATYVENLSPVVPDDKKPVLNEISRQLMDIKSRYKKSL